MGDIRALCCEQAMAVLRLQHSGMEEASIAYQATFLVGGYETLLARWIKGGCRENAPGTGAAFSPDGLNSFLPCQ